MVESSSSELEIESVEVLNIRSRHDDIHVEYLGTVDGSFSLSDVEIGELSGRMNADSKFGSLRVKRVMRGVEKVDLRSNKTDIVMGLAPDYDGRFDLDINDNEILTYPKDMQITDSGLDSEKRTFVRGTIGTGTESVVMITSENGHVQIGDR
jgi:hypothetical protein